VYTMHPGGSRRIAMSLLQNYMLRNSIDRAFLNRSSVTGVASLTRPSVGIFSVAGRNMSTSGASCGHSTSDRGSSSSGGNGHELHVEPLDQESLSKLNELKQGLQMKNEYFEKYKDKLSKLETAAPRELLARLEQLNDAKKDQVRRLKTAEKAAKKPAVLNDVMHMDSLKNLDRIDIVNLWQEFHRHKEGLLAAVMSGTVYDKMSNLASVHKLFVMPLPRPDGYEFFFMQFEHNTFHFTPLIMYQKHQDSAPVALRLINYVDLKTEKDLVLLRGEYDAKLLRAEDAHFLAVQTNFYYGEVNESRLSLLEKFTKEPDQFKHLDLIDELKKIQETHAQLFEFEPVSKPNAGPA